MFIAFEGLDGSGSSTHSRHLAEWLKKAGKTVLLTKEPTDDERTGKLIRAALRHEWQTTPEGLQLLFTADRAHHIATEIGPALARGETVITDRYLFSSLAYGAMDVDMAWLKTLNQPFPLPDLTFLLKADPAVCMERIRKRDAGKFEFFEQEEKLRDVWTHYERVAAEYPNIELLDANQPIEAVDARVRDIISHYEQQT